MSTLNIHFYGREGDYLGTDALLKADGSEPSEEEKARTIKQSYEDRPAAHSHVCEMVEGCPKCGCTDIDHINGFAYGSDVTYKSCAECLHQFDIS